MDYTMCYTEDLMTDQKLSLNKNGNKYYISLSNGEQTIIKNFDSLEVAQNRYMRLINIIIPCWYSFEERKKLLMED